MTVNTLAMDLRTTRLQVGKRGISGHPAGRAPRIKSAVQTLCALRTAYTVPHYSKHRQRPAHLRSTPLSTDTDRPPGLPRYIPLPRRFLRFFFLQHTTTTTCESSSHTRRSRGLRGPCPAPLVPPAPLTSWTVWRRPRRSLWPRAAATAPPSDRPTASAAPPSSSRAGLGP